MRSFSISPDYPFAFTALMCRLREVH